MNDSTMAPITEEVAVIPFGGVPPGDDAYALAFGIPTNTPGLKFICRETVSPLPRSRFDHPLSSRFEEMDCIAVFDDVLVPWDRVMVDGSPGSGEIINTLGADFGALLNVQTAARMLSQLEFFCGLGMKVADAIGITGFLHVQEKLGEMLSQMEVARAVFYGSEAMAQRAEVFPSDYRAILAAGEAGGVAGQVLTQIAELLARRLEIRNKIASALVYPMILIAMSLVSVVVIDGLLCFRARFGRTSARRR